MGNIINLKPQYISAQIELREFINKIISGDLKPTPEEIIEKIQTALEKQYFTKNIFDCPPTLWDQFSPKGKEIYNNILCQSIQMQASIKHPQAREMEMKHWFHQCHGIATLAAMEVNDKFKI